MSDLAVQKNALPAMQMDEAELMQVVGFEGLYVVSSQGEIKSVERVVYGKKKQTVREKVIGQFDNGHGYKTVRLWKDGKQKIAYVHRIVLEAFVGSALGNDACHNDGDRANNDLSNLRLDTRSNNHADKLIHGTMPNGEMARAAKLTADKVVSIRMRLSHGAEQKEMADLFSVSQPTISDIATRRTWKHI